MSGQGYADRMGQGLRQRLRSAALSTLALVCPGGALAADRPTPSGLPVPRYVSLKFDTVNARSGPGDDHRLVWVYRVRGLPLQVVAETSEWRRVCDPEGGLVWVHKRTVDLRRTVMNVQATPVALRRKPETAAPATAYLASRAVAAVDRCEDGWCRLKVAGVKGWSRQADLWGAADRLQCR